jgi:hemoglobin
MHKGADDNRGHVPLALPRRYHRRLYDVVMVDLLDTHVYALIGEEGFARLAAAFYRRVPADEILGRLYPPDDLVAAEQRLREFLVMRFGGPQRYLEQRGHPRLRMRHARFVVDQPARDRWVELMGQALSESQFSPVAERLLRGFFDDAATFLINHPPPGI